ncbi:unnamed protein product [Schistosoma margrebowiei]|uniref:Uncharacterized protein n=1 Tax=Schistosoma margrebowiei TaxID=48269 RepID=A0A183MIS3_9TREM|nr:unnamed protein product [Schistosoma margrebowiei]
MVVGGSQQETLDPGFVLLGTRQQGVPVILKELADSISCHPASHCLMPGQKLETCESFQIKLKPYLQYSVSIQPMTLANQFYDENVISNRHYNLDLVQDYDS